MGDINVNDLRTSTPNTYKTIIGGYEKSTKEKEILKGTNCIRDIGIKVENENCLLDEKGKLQHGVSNACQRYSFRKTKDSNTLILYDNKNPSNNYPIKKDKIAKIQFTAAYAQSLIEMALKKEGVSRITINFLDNFGASIKEIEIYNDLPEQAVPGWIGN